ncbi:hypothetical protein EMIHUDRAFT_197919 [Emiliania huxleyi CCMP1516]|uniref:LisH domain-containing protein n=2 Tax=Emiliania huxleyi TaxID=2903 RepID=A0A0D3IDY6_EMIH1|nr:hypothetical protein EMIHUDRAFT_197919 [Emiliania huxleyi CCMP1516]EOD09471.1 hypothetical protein EMIHUDRAFT_197919 [Emiliania huxleyi CCMP1516]|eukprot:XP_005761900.1 hypothetical protein EMIHUDRAFT_197919 [Emiliania huxleyi CCMP1516]
MNNNGTSEVCREQKFFFALRWDKMASSVAASSVAASSASAMTDDEKTAEELLLAMGDYTPAIPEEVTAHFLAQSGFQATDERLCGLAPPAGGPW